MADEKTSIELPQNIKDSLGKTPKSYLIPDIIYKSVGPEVANIQCRIDQAFDLLFEATIQKMSTKND